MSRQPEARPGRGWAQEACGRRSLCAVHMARKCRVPREGPGWRGSPQRVWGGGTGSGLPPLTPLSPLQRRKAPHEGVYNVSRGTISLGELGEGRDEGRLRPRGLSGCRLEQGSKAGLTLAWLLLQVPGQPGPPRARVVPSGGASPSKGRGRAPPVARSWSPECCPSGKAPSPPRCGSDGKGTLVG